MNGNLMRLYARNRGAANRKFEVSAADDSTDATVYVYDVIVDSEAEAEWWGGVAPGAFVRQIAALKGKTIHLRFNCPGGSVSARARWSRRCASTTGTSWRTSTATRRARRRS